MTLALKSDHFLNVKGDFSVCWTLPVQGAALCEGPLIGLRN
jgi:hypothetical protein